MRKELALLSLTVSLVSASAQNSMITVDRQLEERVENTLSRMSLDEKIGQMVRADQYGTDHMG